MISVELLQKSYDKIIAVDAISFKIEKGEIFGLLGPNGAGKTTTISILAGLIKSYSGTVHIDGQRYYSQYKIRKRIGIVPQTLSFYEKLTGKENLVLFARLYGFTGKTLQKKVEWALDFVGLSKRASQLSSYYSGGMKRRLNLACALLHDPAILFLDEPTVGVDPQSRNLIFDNIEALKEQGCTILYTTHYMEEAQRLCDHVAIMSSGKILALDRVDSLIKKYGGESVIEMELAEVPADIQKLPGQLQDKVLTVITNDVLAVLSQLLESKIKFLDIRIKQPNLERVFLNLTGRRLQDK